MKTLNKPFYFSNYQKHKVDFDYVQVFEELTKITAEMCKQKIKSFSVSFVSDNEIKKINNKYRNINKVTDVISFSYKDNHYDNFLSGEMYICIKQAIKQAKSFNHSIKREICFLFVHGLLHILGYNHNTLSEEQTMFTLQEKILQKGNIIR